MNITQTTIWQQLRTHQADAAPLRMRDLFANDPQRDEKYSLTSSGLTLDYSKNRITQETLELLFQLADTQHLKEKISQMFRGDIVNISEQRPALHTLLRNTSRSDPQTQEHARAVAHSLEKMKILSEQIREKKYLGHTGKPITHVVNLGIGGSHLGPALVCEALQPFSDTNISIEFVSNVDGHALATTLEKLNPETTLFIVSSKSFGTHETLLNATTAKNWLGSHAAIQKNMLAVTAKPQKAIEFGLHENNILELWDWISGRYSLWSAIGLTIAIQIGMSKFHDLLAGAKSMDEHFASQPWQNNMPVILALLSIWYTNFFHTQSEAILPYAEQLRLLPAYLQQLLMESTGKSTNVHGDAIAHASCPIIWGHVGCNGQHAFHQLLHQGTTIVPADFIIAKNVSHDLTQHHDMLVKNCFSQTQALMAGNTDDDILTLLKAKGHSDNEIKSLLPFYRNPGNRPSNTILLDEINPHTLGALLALYEHKTYVQACLWDINCFDQCGVEWGKQLVREQQPY